MNSAILFKKNSGRKYLHIIFFLLVANTCLSQDIISNQSIIELSKAGIDKTVIVNKIKQGPNQFDLSGSGVARLKGEKVVESLIEEMLISNGRSNVIGNEDIILMSKASVSDNLISKIILYSDCRFETGTSELVRLKKEKVSDRIMKIMVNPKANEKAKFSDKNKNDALTTEIIPNHPQNITTPTIAKFKESGIYYEQFEPNIEYVQLEPTTTNQRRNSTIGESIGNSLTNGIVGKSKRIGLANKSAGFLIKDRMPVFYFVFDGQRKNFNKVKESVLKGIQSPNDFVLIKANVSNRGREIVIARESSYTEEKGFSEKTVPFKFKKVSNQLYKVYFEEALPAGEYVFLYNKGSEENSSLKIFDFSLRNNVQ